jgi:transposase
MTLLRLVRQAPGPPAARTPRVLGVDEWSHRHGRQYGLILVDQERHRPIDLLTEASAKMLATWLREHPGVEVVSRDRGGPLADGARQGAPDAVQVADRFHLLQNLGRVAERVVRRHATLVGRLPAPHVATLPTTLLRPDRQASRDRTRQALQDLLTAIQQLKASGATISSTARALHLNWKTVHKYWSTTEASERRYTARPSSSLTPYEGYVQQRWRQGVRKALPLWRELVERGYSGKYQTVARYMAALKRLAHGDQHQPQPVPNAGLSVRHAVAIALRRPDRRTPAEERTLESVAALHPELQHVLSALRGFAALLRQRPMQPAAELEAWKAKALASRIPELTAFITKLEQDRDAVVAGLSLPYSQGQTEGQITRLKALKRAMFGRANFDLLRKRFLVVV